MPRGSLPKTHCKRGHEYTPENTGWQKFGRSKYCKQCQNKRSNEFHYNKSYGMTAKEAESAKLNPCEICGLVKEDMVIDHNHETNKVRGILCSNCNNLLGFASDREEILINAIEYLKKKRND